MQAQPEVLRFKAKLYERADAIKSVTGASLAIPDAVGVRLRGMEKVEGTINGHPFRASLESGPKASHALRVNEAMLRGARAKRGSIVRLAILGPEPSLIVPADLRAAMAASPQAQDVWKILTTLGRRDWVRWIEAAKTSGTRARRVRRTVEQLTEGKHRPCCVDVYQYMLRHVGRR